MGPIYFFYQPNWNWNNGCPFGFSCFVIFVFLYQLELTYGSVILANARLNTYQYSDKIWDHPDRSNCKKIKVEYLGYLRRNYHAFFCESYFGIYLQVAFDLYLIWKFCFLGFSFVNFQTSWSSCLILKSNFYTFENEWISKMCKDC